jgi:hypothetical protein
MRAVLVLLCSGLFCGAAFAADPPAATAPSAPDTTPATPPVTPQVVAPLDEATGAILSRIFTDVCFGLFPDDAATDAKLAAGGGVAMTPQQVKAILHDDPGHGWIVIQDGHAYSITIEAPPFHACAVRVNTPAGVAATGLADMLGKLVAAKGQQAGRPQTLPVPPNPLMQIRAVLVPLSPAPAGADAEAFMAFVTTYRDRATNAVLTVENRFVHQIHAAPLH